MPTSTDPIYILVLFMATCVQRVQRQHVRFITGEYINVLSDPSLKYRWEVSVLCSNNLFKLIEISYIDLIPVKLSTRGHNLHLILEQPKTAISIFARLWNLLPQKLSTNRYHYLSLNSSFLSKLISQNITVYTLYQHKLFKFHLIV